MTRDTYLWGQFAAKLRLNQYKLKPSYPQLSVDLGARDLHHLSPFGGFGINEFDKFLWRVAAGDRTLDHQFFFDRGRVQ